MKLYSYDSYLVLACEEPTGRRKSYRLKLLSPQDEVCIVYSMRSFPVGEEVLLNVEFDVLQIPRYARVIEDVDNMKGGLE